MSISSIKVSLAIVFINLFLTAAVSTRGESRQTAHTSASSKVYDIVIRNGRVMDPETRLDAIRNIGVNGGVIRIISTKPLRGRVVIDATGPVVAPGYIDVIWEIPTMFESVRLLDGVTTALRLWIGTNDVDKWYAEREGRALANFGVAVGHVPIRMAVMRDPGKLLLTGDAQKRRATEAEITHSDRRRALHLSTSAHMAHILLGCYELWKKPKRREAICKMSLMPGKPVTGSDHKIVHVGYKPTTVRIKRLVA
jgi:hypothetical protein